MVKPKPLKQLQKVIREKLSPESGKNIAQNFAFFCYTHTEFSRKISFKVIVALLVNFEAEC
jgi:hypothetical protein